MEFIIDLIESVFVPKEEKFYTNIFKVKAGCGSTPDFIFKTIK